jgi:uncharacterized protein (TIGR00730 family)
MAAGIVKNVHRATPFRDLRILLIAVWDFLKGFWLMGGIGLAVTVFGSARFPRDHRFYALGEKTGKALADAGYAVITGGGPSMMEAASKGCVEAGGYAVGCNIHIPREQHPNPFVQRYAIVKYFFVRKFMLTRYAAAFVVLPGGFGTLDELFEIITLVQTGKLTERPIVLIGREYWSGMLKWINDTMVSSHAVSAHEMANLHLVDSPEEAVSYIRERIGSYRPSMAHDQSVIRPSTK